MPARRQPAVSFAARPLIGLVRVYQAIGRPFFGGHCRFRPTCSEYAIDALRTHGAWQGGLLASRRLLRCHPWGGLGHDPVPDTERESEPARYDGPPVTRAGQEPDASST